MRKNYTFELKPNTEDLSVQIFMPFTLIWKNKEYNGTFLVSMSKNIGVEEYGIEWSDEAPDFGELETEIYEEIEEKLLEEVLKQYNIH
jgi:hypothetical protein